MVAGLVVVDNGGVHGQDAANHQCKVGANLYPSHVVYRPTKFVPVVCPHGMKFVQEFIIRALFHARNLPTTHI